MVLPLAEGARASELTSLLRGRNGFYAFESALHVLPSRSAAPTMSIELWNAPDLWQNEYGGDLAGVLFFAEDIFGCQFGVQEDAVVTFDPEIGQIEPFAHSLQQWAEEILKQPDVLTGFSVGHRWQQKRGPIPPGSRLVPATPFIAGGSFEIENLNVMSAVEGMRFRAEICRQTRHLPDGTQVRIRVE